ncbi:uncharacterized protein BO66DRAFT_433545 [Aspergillus aculeatinus CBS 121060]|uniref:Uncharacterized protein n=1 Tax=Aspergillus aculeatinus CBS 121060 TaxID=1448322 RepID=A0ACD1HP57_9EURO|nr:hypothetical protein BO66DRAFT_433545 [Aspergillus aculeatinus CBS 121060]RAH75472.1 hypothetical protein BO66DRAFT_433545 [Aspergillus aculeatinus CBS 121060]
MSDNQPAGSSEDGLGFRIEGFGVVILPFSLLEHLLHLTRPEIEAQNRSDHTVIHSALLGSSEFHDLVEDGTIPVHPLDLISLSDEDGDGGEADNNDNGGGLLDANNATVAALYQDIPDEEVEDVGVDDWDEMEYVEEEEEGEEEDEVMDVARDELTCANEIPTYASVSGLCSRIVPTSVNLPPAARRGSPNCRLYSYGNAVFVICNTSTCHSRRFTAQRQTCNRIYNNCRRRSKGGYVKYSGNAGFSSSYRSGTTRRPPAYAVC